MEDWCIYDYAKNIVVFRGTKNECYRMLDMFENCDIQVIPEGEV